MTYWNRREKGQAVYKGHRNGCRLLRRDERDARYFLMALFGHESLSGMQFGFWSRRSKRTTWFSAAETREAARFAVAEAKRSDVYVRVTAVKQPPSKGRGGAEVASAVVGLWLDVDIQDAAHKKSPQLPPNRAEAERILREFPHPPTCVIESGHGLQAWWLFRKPWLLVSDTERRSAAEFTRQFQATMQSHAKRLGYVLDMTHDLARVMRLPGTMNRKREPVPVRLTSLTDNRIEPGKLRKNFVEGPSPDPVGTASSRGIELKAHAEPPRDKLEELLRCDTRFAATWNYQREDLTSLSECDMAIANRLVEAGWPDQQIADALIAFRRTHGDEDGQKKALRPGYLSQTIQKARAGKYPQPESTFRLFTAEEIKNMPPVEWLVKDILPAGSLSVLYGPSNVGKSFLGLDIALSIGAGIPWCRREIQKGTVVYIAAEGSSGLRARLKAWEKGHSACASDVHFLLEPVQFHLEQSVDRFISALRGVSCSPSLVVIDTMARSLVGGDENSAKDVGSFISGLDRIKREFQCAVLIVHHTGKSGDLERGSSALRAAADMMLKVPKSDHQGELWLECDKAKEAAAFKTVGLNLKTIVIDEGDETSCYLIQSPLGEWVQLSKNQRDLLAVAKQLTKQNKTSEGLTWSELRQVAKLPDSSFEDALDALIAKGRLLRSGSARKTRYSIPETQLPPAPGGALVPKHGVGG